MSEIAAEINQSSGAVLLNNGQWHDLVRKQMAEDAAANNPASIILIDLNNLKSVNDEEGHAEGDVVLGAVSFMVDALAKTLRTGKDRRSNIAEPYLTIEPRTDDEIRRAEHDRRANDTKDGDLFTHRVIKEKDANLIDAIAGRVGGDEFAIYAATDEKGAEAIRERLRNMFDEQLNANPIGAKLKELGVGMAIGISTLTADKSPSEVLAEADALMYQDKLAQLPKYNVFQKSTVWITTRMYKLAGIKIADVHKRTRM